MFDYMLAALLEGVDIVDDNVLNSFAIAALNGQLDMHDMQVQHDMNNMLTICNILYNNSDRSILPVEDGVYDKLMVLALNYIPDLTIGAPPTDIQIQQKKLRSPFIREQDLTSPLIKIDEEKFEQGLFTGDLTKPPVYIKEQFYTRPLIPTENISRRMINTPHEFPKLVGTLDKAKFVLCSQAEEAGVLDDENVSVFERDFLHKHLEMGIIDYNTPITLLATLKMDGVSVEARVSDRIISARSRGDTANDLATDLTPALSGYKFPKTRGMITDEESFGMKFECMISNDNLKVLGDLRGVEYVNPRNAIIGLLGSGDCNQWLEYIDLIPLETSLDLDPLTEIEFMNVGYAKEPLRYAVITGTYEEVLFQVKKFAEEAEFLRPIMPYIYDGVVITYVDENIRRALGRNNSINKYSIAIKFNPMNKYTKFLGYTYSVGQNGIITPIAHYNPIELFGATHTKTTVHSLRRFDELELREGDIVSISLVNDVIPYISKPDVYENSYNTNPIIEFPTTCPSCGTPIEYSQYSKIAYCPNMQCPERRLAMITNMLAKIGFKGFSLETLSKIQCIDSLNSLVNIKPEQLSMLGPVERENFLQRVEELVNANLYDYRLVGALGFSNISQERWAKILREVSLAEIISLSNEELYNRLLKVSGIGKTIANTIIDEREFFMDDLILIDRTLIHKTSYGSESSIQIRFSGARDKELMEYLQSIGIDCTEGAVTTKTNIILVPYIPYSSSKTKKAPVGCQVIPLGEFKSNMDRYLEV